MVMGRLPYIFEDGHMATTLQYTPLIPLDPENEQYFDTRGGFHFKRTNRNGFYYLDTTTWEWVFDPTLEDYYYDAATSCIEINYTPA